jgi:alkylation response protein AidB-like acyl-CoA dehydrogenase
MQFALSDEQAMIAETAGQFFAEQATSERTRAAMVLAPGYDEALWNAFTAELGLGGLLLPEDQGGVGLGRVEFALVAEAAGRHVAALPLLASLGLAAPAILKGGSDAQRSAWLPALGAGEVIGTLVEGDFTLSDGRLSGTASYVPHGAAAGLFVVAAGEGLYLLPRDTVGVTVMPLVTMDQTRPYARLVLDNALAEPLPDPAAGRDAAHLTGWIALAADALGGAQACLDRTVAYAKERVQFGRAIGSFQAIKHRLADMMVEIEQARSAVWWAACAADEGADDALLAAHSAKAFACDAYSMCAGNMIQLHGGIGFTWEHDAHLYFKRARANASLLGSPDWHREQVAALIGLGEAA